MAKKISKLDQIKTRTPRGPHKPTRAFRDKSKYTRKVKHKKGGAL